MIDQVKIGNFLKDLRKEKGKTQEDIAQMCGVSSRSVSRWENGNTMPDLSILVELADYYDVSMGEIIDGKREDQPMDAKEKETLLKIADYADKQKRRAIIRALIFFGLDMVFSGITIGAAILVLKSNGTISPGYAVIPLWISLIFNAALIINTKRFKKKFSSTDQQDS